MRKIVVHVTPDGRLSRADAARYLGLSVKALAERKRRGLRPFDLMVGSRSFYRLSELDAFIASGENCAIK